MSTRLLSADGSCIDLTHIEPALTLAPTDDPVQLVPRLNELKLICIDFPKFADGRGYSIAARLRQLGFKGELRATGDVLVDQLFFLKRVGFTTFALRADEDLAAARKALATYSAVYQAAGDALTPAFRRRSASEVAA